MLCQQCDKKASVRCCSTILLCGFHFTQHFALKKNHQPEQLLFRLDPNDQSILITKLINRISTLKDLKVKIMSYTKSLIKNIECFQSTLINEINKAIQNYQTIFNTQDFPNLYEPEKILETQMLVNNSVLKP